MNSQRSLFTFKKNLNLNNAKVNFRVKYYFSRFWLALTTAFLLVSPYSMRYANESNRVSFHWTLLDAIGLLTSIVLIGTVFFVLFLTLHIYHNKVANKICGLSFVIVFNFAVVANLIHMFTKSSKWRFNFLPSIKFILFLACMCLILYAVIKGFNSIKKYSVTLCFVISPVLLLFSANALTYSTWQSGVGDLQSFLEQETLKRSDKPNVFIFLFDEWSFQRSFMKQDLIDSFVNVKTFKEQSLVFYKAYSPNVRTMPSMSSLLFQTHWPVRFLEGKIVFKVSHESEADNKPIDKIESADIFENIFEHPRGLGLHTFVAGFHIPYGALLGHKVDYSHSYNFANFSGQNFFNTIFYHLISAAEALDPPFLTRLIGYYNIQNFIKIANGIHNIAISVIENKTAPVLGFFHYNFPHSPYVFTHKGPKKNMMSTVIENYKRTPKNYYANLEFLDTKIGELIVSLKKNNKFEDSLIIMTSDHSWILDPEFNRNTNPLELRHIPLFIKFPHQKQSIDIHTEFSTVRLGDIIKSYLNNAFNYREAPSILNSEYYKVMRNSKAKPPARVPSS